MPSDDFKDDDELFKRFSSRDNENYKGDIPDDDKMKSPLGEEDSHEEENDYDENDREENENEKEEGDFFTDSDFEFKDYKGEDYDEGGARSQRIRGRRRKTRIILSTIIIMSILVLIAIGIVFGYRFIKNKYFSNKETTTSTTNEAIVVPSTMKLGKDMNVVIAGAGKDLLEPEINSILFSRYTSSKGELVTLCVPVNTLMEIPGFGLESVNKSVGYGGMDLLKLTLKNNLGMDVTNYVLIDIVDSINKLEGLKITLEEAVTLDGDGGTKIELKKGENIINGETALAFLKNFSGTNAKIDVSNVEKQKILLDSLAKKLAGEKEGDLAKNLTKIKDYIDSDLKLEELSELVATLSGLTEDKNKSYVLEGSTVELEGSTFYVPDIAKVAEIFNQEGIKKEEETEAATGETLTMSVLNGVGIKGIAAKTSEIFKGLKYSDGKAKYNVSTVGDADNYNYANTQVILKSGDAGMMAAGEEIKKILKVGNIKTQEGSSQKTDVVVIIGKDFNYDAALASLNEVSSETTAASTTETSATTENADKIMLVNILNGEGTQGIAATVKKIIEDNLNKSEKVLTITETKNADNFNYKQTKIVIFTKKDGIENIASKIKEVLGVGVISNSTNNVDKVDITIILGSDYTK
jgi:anionic cell wall polymer biosynthesis LytR-Cps2A-Psr (LCP) family protein